MIRPEHVVLGQGPSDAIRLTAQVERLVYFGTDTHIHMRLRDGTPLVARVQNALRGGAIAKVGDSEPVAFSQDALRLLPDTEA